MPPRRTTRNQAKEDEKKKKDELEEEEESEEEEEKTTKGKKGTAKGKAAAKKPAAKGKGRGKSKDESEEEESEEEEKSKRGGRGASKKAAPKGKGKRSASNSPSGSEDDEEEDDKKAPVKKGKGESSTSVKKVITKGGAAVDEHFDQDDCHVYQAGGVTYSKTLNQSDLQKNNNKFYIIQLLESDDKKTYYTFNRWGRVGYKGQLNSWSFDDALDAVHDFTKKLREKKGRGYIEIDINYDDASDEEDKKTKAAHKGKGKKKDESEEESEEEEVKKKAISKKADKKKKRIPIGDVDEYFDEKNCEVYRAKGMVYTLKLGHDNNKFYIIQLLESTKDEGTFFVWSRWGRGDVKGQTMKKKFNSAASAIEDFDKKNRDKIVEGYGTLFNITCNFTSEEEEEEVKKKSTPKKADKKEDKEEEKKEVVKKVITKGGAAVDEYFDEKDCEVYMANGKVYAKTLNQSNLGHNNNKFYIIQILESTKNKGTFFVWNRWGRVGVKGQTMKKKVNSAAAAIEEFDKKFYDKTVKGDYVEIEINYDDENDAGKDDKDEEEKNDKADAKSKLPEQTKDLIKLIFDLKMMNNQMKEIGYDPSRMPLGKLSKNAIQKGYEVLKQLADAIEKKRSKDVLSQLSSQFYSQIPHDFGFKPMANFILDTDKKVKEKLEMLASLEDIQIATKLLDEGKNSSEDSLIDSNYAKLKCGLTPCDSKSDEFKMVLDYIKNTHASTHSSYSLELINLFAVEREGEAERYTKDIHNKQLLWHGSRLTNYVGILSQGLRIAPPEAPVTGYMFGKGVYFADMVSKSANYCFTNPQNNTGIMLLCEVALGNCNEKLHADYNSANLPPNKHSTKGCGRTAPAANGTRTVDGDVAVPMGKGENINLQGGALLYNEFIVYDVKQIKIRYLLRLKFNYRYNY